MALLQLGLDIAVADDGSGDQLGEQGDVQQEFEIGPLNAHLTPVDIHHIAHGLEGVEADADGQGNLRHRQRKAGDLIEGGDEEAGVFEHAQGQQIDDDRQYQHPAIGLALFPSGAHPAARAVVHRRRDQQQEQIHRLAPGVEYQAENHQHHIFCLQARHREIADQAQGQK